METLDPVIRVVLECGLPFAFESRSSLTPLHRAVIAQTYDSIAAYSQDIDVQDAYGRTPLYFAVTLFDEECTKMLLDMGADPNVTEPYKGYGPLHVACENGHLAIVKLLLESTLKPVNVNLESKMDGTGILLACKYQNWSCIELLHKRSNLDLVDANGFSILHLIVEKSPGDIASTLISKLIQNSANMNAQDANGNTCLHIACMNGNLEMIKILLTMSKLDVAVVNNLGQTALHVASVKGFVIADKMAAIQAMIQELMNAGIPVHAKDNEGNTASDLIAIALTEQFYSKKERVALNLGKSLLTTFQKNQEMAQRLEQEEEMEAKKRQALKK